MPKTVLYKNIEIHYNDFGKGNVLVLLHGFLENQKMWLPFTNQLSLRNRVITIDLLGHGQTKPSGYVHTMEDNANFVLAVLRELKIKKIVFIGHSMGGYVALAFAELYPEMVKGLLLINSTALADSPEKKTNRDRAIQLVKTNYVSFIDIAITNLFSLENQIILKSDIESTIKQALLTPIQGIVATLEGMKIRKDREVLLHFLQCPILFILGNQDTILDFETTSKQIQGTKVELVSFDGGHMLYLENKSEFLKIIIAYLKKIKA